MCSPQAHQKYLQVLELKGVVETTELSQQVTDVLTKAKVTKTSACLIDMVVTNASDGVACRKLVQAELKEFRVFAGPRMEQKMLHPTLWTKIQGVLKGDM
eukprot:4526983-Amphidinium_carterae.3